MPVVKKKGIRGAQGSWDVVVTYTDGTKQTLPTAHKFFWKGRNRYERGGPDDPTWEYYRAQPRFPDHVALLKQTKRVAVTIDDFDRNSGLWQRKDYVGVFDIDDITVDGTDMSFRFVDRLPEA
jgi:hypothetical protein